MTKCAQCVPYKSPTGYVSGSCRVCRSYTGDSAIISSPIHTAALVTIRDINKIKEHVPKLDKRSTLFPSQTRSSH